MLIARKTLLCAATFFAFILKSFLSKDTKSSSSNLPNVGDIRILGIEPNSGPTTGETRVQVRLQNFNADLIDDYPHPNCRFGSLSRIVAATYVKCSPKPRRVGEPEPTPEEKTEICIQCENSKPHDGVDIVPFTVSLLGDFTDIVNSVPFRFYLNPTITWIYPRYGPKNGGTLVEVFGENFLNFDQNFRCAFGSREVKAKYINDHYMTCITPISDVVQKKLPFSVSLNNQQNTKEDIPFVYYEYPQVFRLEPNRGPDTGGTLVRIRGQNFNPMVEIPEMNNFNDTFCIFGNLSITNGKVISSTEMDCVSPPSYEARFVPVEISLNNREWTKDNVLFYYYHPPFIYFIHPKIGPVQGGTVVTITGSNFEDTGYVMCKFGDKLSQGTYISQNELRCTSPPVEKPATVNWYVAIHPDEFSSGINTKFRYYDTPILQYIEPMCGPERGFTQITVYGKNFPVGYSEDVKCVFDRKIYANATVMDEHSIKCDSPSVLNYDGKNEMNITEYKLEITLNGADINGPIQMFYYYKSPVIHGIEPIMGPVEGGTTVNITGSDFKQPGACNITTRFATYHAKPVRVEHDYIIVKSPTANYTGAVVVQVALNGQQFEKDLTVSFRDYENTFYYYNCPQTFEMKPRKGPTIGKNDINIYGVGYIEPFYAIDVNTDEFQSVERTVYYRFVDEKDDLIVYGDIQTTEVTKTQMVTLKAPNVYINNTVARVQLSYNGENFCNYNQTYTFFWMPNITKITPEYGPLKSADYTSIDLTVDNYYCTTNCDRLICKYKSKTKTFFEKGEYTKPNHISCEVPAVNTPDSYEVEVSFNEGEDYTHNGKTYTFYDPYVMRVEPQIVTSKGGTRWSIHGYGFANSGSNWKVLYGSETGDGKWRCDYKQCVTQGEYESSEWIHSVTKPRSTVIVDKTGENLEYQRFAVEVSVYNDDFTNNNITIFYFDEPEIVNDWYNSNINMTNEEKDEWNKVLLRTLPSNVDTFIPIPVDGSKILKHFKELDPYTNYTCQYEILNVKTNKLEYKETSGIYTSFPLEENKKNIFLCQSPVWYNVGNSKIRISINGHDYSDSAFWIEFTDPIKLLKIEPLCGPIEGKTQVNLFGTGFQDNKEYVFKWGPQNLVPLTENSFFKQATTSEITFTKNTDYEIRKIIVSAPHAPNQIPTRGGLDYISVSKLNFLPWNEFLSKYYINSFIHTNFEYYYYHEVYVESFKPHGSIVTGGTEVVVIGAWFQYKPEYETKPYCKFGEKIVEATYLSTVRISCIAPEYPKANVRVRFGVSLNKYDFIYAEEWFTYYNDFTNAKFESLVPSSGPVSGGTSAKLYGQNFTNLVTETEFLCQFKSDDKDLPPMNVPAQYKEYPEINKTAIICNTPGGWKSGSKTKIWITFDGQNFMDTGFTFYFYKIDEIYPRSGPNTGWGEINIDGAGFKNSSKVKFYMDNIEFKPWSIKQNKIKCPIPEMNPDFTGYVDMAITLNGIDENKYKDGFYYYIQPIVNSVYPKSGPSKGKASFRVYGEGFRNDFRGVNIGCKVGNYYGVGELISNSEIRCNFTQLPWEKSPKILKPKKAETKLRALKKSSTVKEEEYMDSTFFVQIALNNYSFTEINPNATFTPYGILSIEPSSGPISGGTRVIVKGAGFFNSKSIRCRYGVSGYFAYTEAEFIDYNNIACKSPENFKIPKGGQLPFSVPFSIAFNEDEFNPWTETTHFFSFYKNPDLVAVEPKEGKTSETTTVIISADSVKGPFSMPSATIIEDQYDVWESDNNNNNNNNQRAVTSFAYQPIICRFGRFGMTEAEYLNRTHLKCLTPNIADDSDIGYEEINVEVALNGVDFISNDDTEFTFIGPNAGNMIWIYLLIILFIAILIIILLSLASSYWSRILMQYQGINAYQADESHVQMQQLKYLNKNKDGNNAGVMGRRDV